MKYEKIEILINIFINWLKIIIVLGVQKLDFSIAFIFWSFLALNKFLNLGLNKFQLFNLAKISIILFSLFFYLFIFTTINSIFFNYITNINKYFANFINVV